MAETDKGMPPQAPITHTDGNDRQSRWNIPDEKIAGYALPNAGEVGMRKSSGFPPTTDEFGPAVPVEEEWN